MKKFYQVLTMAIAAAMIASCGDDGNGGSDGPDSPEVVPTKIMGFKVLNASLEADPEGFNMLTDGGFEFFPGDAEWASKSLWYIPEYDSEAETAHSGKRTIHVDGNSHDWRDFALQTIASKKNVSYTLTLNYAGSWKGLNVYMGFRNASGAPALDQNTNNVDGNDAWAEYKLSYGNTDNTELTAFIGGWCWDNLWVEMDDFKVIPTGTSYDTFRPSRATLSSLDITNNSANVVSSSDKIVAWKEADGSISAVLHNAVIGSSTLGNVFATSKDKDISDGITFTSVGGTSIADNAVVTSGVAVNGTEYVHYYVNAGKPAATEDNPDPDWYSNETGTLVSKDGGSTWSKLSGDPSGNYVKVSYCDHGGYVYMFGSAAGDKNVRTYVARTSYGNMGDPSSYEYYDGETWVAGKPEFAAPVFFGPTDDMSIVYDQSRYTYMIFYRSATTNRLVYRDSGLPEGEWSGEKIVADAEDIYAPSILSSGKDGIVMVVSPFVSSDK